MPIMSPLFSYTSLGGRYPTRWHKGRPVSFENTILVTTSSVGVPVTFSKKPTNTSREKTFIHYKLLGVAKEEPEAGVKPEFLNRLDEIVVFFTASRDG